MRIRVREAAQPFYSLQVGQPLRAAWAAGERIGLSFVARSPTSNRVRVAVEQAGPPWANVAEIVTEWSPEWRPYGVTQTTDRAWAAGELWVRIQAGFGTGEMEIADLRIQRLGPDPRLADARSAVAPAAVAERTRRLRQCELVVRVRDGAGRPVRGARVEVHQQKHSFLFGCNIFLLDPANTEPWQREYQRRFGALLNYATLPFYWGAYEPVRGQRNETKLEAMARWCEERGIAAKGHPICWHEVWPRWAPVSAEEAIPLLEARVRQLIPRYQKWIRYWDVWNEANAAAAPAHRGTGIGDWVRRDGPALPVMTALRWAREVATPDTVLLYNDFDVSARNERLLRTLAASNALPDAIGLQSHMHDGPWSLERLWEVTERFAVFGRPIHFTEMTVVSGARARGVPVKERYEAGEWPTTPEGEAAQADYVEQAYRVLFSHPQVEAITWWDFSDRGAWKRAPAGWLRADMSPKPVYERLMRLIRGEWWTDATATTDSTGTVRVRVWRGTHRVRAIADGKSLDAIITIPLRAGATAEITLTL
ncbi:MAG: endo-1,4-beta-xylanase [Kiritimatiellae bacterium]|nr:endo-1,4-beta-xylanase [Kiritimatiellia bacterium]